VHQKLKSELGWQGFSESFMVNMTQLLNKVLFAIYFLLSAIFLVTDQRILTIFSVIMLTLLNSMRLWVWYNHERQKSNLYTNCCRAFISFTIDVEILLVSIKMDKVANLRISTLCAIMWIMLPFFITTGIITSVALVGKLIAACRKSKETHIAELTMILWLFLVFAGGPAFFYLLVYQVQANSDTKYNYTSSIKVAALMTGCYGLFMLIFHILVAKSFK
jgi:hypothetical protein